MLSNTTKMLGSLTLALSVAGCSGSGDESDGAGSAVPQVPLDDAIDAVVTTEDDDAVDTIVGAETDGEGNAVGTTITEVTDSTDTSAGTATPVEPVSTVQMDAFIENPLVAAIPPELRSVASVAKSRSFVTNPLMH